MIRSGRSRRSARAVKTCGVMQFWFASQTSVAVSLARTCSTVPPFFGTRTVGTHAGAPFGMSFWKNPGRRSRR